MRHRGSIATLGILFALAGAVPLGAQSISVGVQESPSGQPLHGAMVTLSDAYGNVVSRTLTDGRGRALFGELDTGSYGVRAGMIGHAGEGRNGVVVGPEDRVTLNLTLPVRAVELEGFDVDGEERCRIRPEEGLRVAQVWGETRKALERARWTEERGYYEYRTQKHVRDVNRRTG